MEEPKDAVTPETGAPSVQAEPSTGRVFLVVVDDSPEMKQALRYACNRARNTDGRVALLYVIEPSEFHGVLRVGDLVREEQRAEAELLMQRMASQTVTASGKVPIIYIREGLRRDALLALIEEEPLVSILVLGAATDSNGPGPLVAALTGKFMGRLRVPITLVPGNLSDELIDAIS